MFQIIKPILMGILPLIFLFYFQFSKPFYWQSTTSDPLQIHKMSKIIDYYVSVIKALSSNPNKNHKISFGYSSDIDIVVDGIELMKSLGFHQVDPLHHSQINDLQQIAQTLAYYFVQGAGAEIRVNNQQAFQALLDQIQKHKNYKFRGLGGNAVTMAIRAQKQKCQVLLGCAMNHKEYNKYFNHTDNKAILSRELQPDGIKDYHLVLDFDKRSEWGYLKSERSNRFYLNYDIDNVELNYMDEFHLKEKQFNSDIIVLSGFHLIQNVPLQQYDQLFKRVNKHIKQINQNQKIHIELGTFFDNQLLDSLVTNIISHSHSIGFNEQELQHLKQSLQNQELDSDIDSKPDAEQILKQIVELIRTIENKKMSLDRLHFHSLKFQAICNTDAWGSSESALVQSIMIAPMLSLYNYQYNTDDMNQELKQQMLQEMTFSYPTSMVVQNIDEQQIDLQFSEEQPVSCWKASMNFQCCVSPMLFAKYPIRTRGLGDNISAMGLIYHKLN